MIASKKNHTVTIRCTLHEKEQLQHSAELEGYRNVSDYIRSLYQKRGPALDFNVRQILDIVKNGPAATEQHTAN